MVLLILEEGVGHHQIKGHRKVQHSDPCRIPLSETEAPVDPIVSYCLRADMAVKVSSYEQFLTLRYPLDDLI